MPHFPKPFFKEGRGVWYVEIDRRQHNLGPDKEAAFARYHELMRNRPKPVDRMTAIGIVRTFFDWVQTNTSSRTVEWYERHLNVFIEALPATLPVSRLKPFHVTQILGQHPRWSSSTKHGFCRAVQRAFRWAEDEERIDRSPLRKLKKPKAKRREVVITDEEFAAVLDYFKSESIRELLLTVWETGCRPQEATSVEARHVDLALARWVFPIDESKGEHFPRVVYLGEKALQITKKLMMLHPTGPLFLNENGNAWTRWSLNCLFGRLQIAHGLRRIKELEVPTPVIPRFRGAAYTDARERAKAKKDHERRIYERRMFLSKEARKYGQKFCLYNFRHTWASNALKRGVDSLTVAILMGHADPSMLAKVYAHLAHDPDFLRNASNRAIRGEDV
jgi:integrase